MSRSPLDYIRHILDELEFLAAESAGCSRDAFLRDETAKRAFVRSIEVMGDATKHIPPEIRARHSHVNRRGMAGMRDVVIHQYFGIDYDIVWDVAAREAPALRDSIRAILDAEGGD